MSLETFILEKLGELLVLESGKYVLKNRRALGSFLKAGVLLRNSRIRMSFSELLRCKDGDAFVVIRSVKHPERFGPIGGAIRANKSGSLVLQNGHAFEFEEKHGPEKYDLRGYTTGKSFAGILSWFYKAGGREQHALTREIVEELTEIGEKELAKSVSRLQFRLHQVVHEGPIQVKGTDYKQYRLFHVYDIDEEDEPSARFKRTLLKVAGKNPELIKVTAKEILTGRSRDGHLVGGHCGYLISSVVGGAGEPPPSRVRNARA